MSRAVENGCNDDKPLHSGLMPAAGRPDDLRHHITITTRTRANPALGQDRQAISNKRRGRAPKTWQTLGKHLLRRGDGATPVNVTILLPAQRPTCALAKSRQQHTQRTWLQQTTHAAAIARRPQRRLGRGIGKNKDAF